MQHSYHHRQPWIVTGLIMINSQYPVLPRQISRLALLFIVGSLVTACAGPSSLEVTRALAPTVSSDRIEEVRLTALLVDGPTLRQMRQSEDLGAWLDDWWPRLEPPSPPGPATR